MHLVRVLLQLFEEAIDGGFPGATFEGRDLHEHFGFFVHVFRDQKWLVRSLFDISVDVFIRRAIILFWCTPLYYCMPKSILTGNKCFKVTLIGGQHDPMNNQWNGPLRQCS